MSLDQNSLPLRDYHKAKRLFWNPQDIEFDDDQQDWNTLPLRERDLICRTLGLFVSGETAVAHDLAPLGIALRREGGHLEEEMFLSTQLFEEAKHVEFFDRCLEFLHIQPDGLATLAGTNYLNLFGELNSALDALLTDNSPVAQVRAVASYHIIIEGVLAETGYYGIFQALRSRNVMPGLTAGIEYVQRDEARHIAFGLHLLTRMLRENPSLWAEADAQLNKLLPLAQGVFMEVLGDFLPDIPFNLDLNDMVSYAGRQYFARLSALERAKTEAH